MSTTAILFALLLPVAEFQPRPIDDRLAPFVGLQGVRLRIGGFVSSFWHVIGDRGADPEKEWTGFTRAENEEFEKALWARSRADLRDYEVPVLEYEQATRITPELVIDVSWMYERPPDRFAVRVDVKLLEAATRVRDGETVWVPSWNVTGVAFATRDSFRKIVQGYVRNYVREFGEAYRRARSPAIAAPSSPAP